MSSPSRPFILRPVATSLLMAAILLAGFVAFRQLPVSALPEVDYPTIQVVTFYPGASPDVMASAVTAPLERQFGQVPGLNQMTSTSSGGSSIIILQFSLDLNIDVAEQEVQAAINAAQTYLAAGSAHPADLQQDQSGRHADSDPGAHVIHVSALESGRPGGHAAGAKDFAVAGRGAGQHQRRTKAGGSHSSESHRALLLRNQSGGCAHRAPATSLDLAKGNFDGPQQDYQIDANDQLLTSKDFQPIVVAYRNGAPVMLSDVAQVIDGAENVKQAAWMNDTPAIIVNIQRQPGANIIQVVDRIKKLLPLLQSTLPAAVNVTVLTDRTTTIRASVKDVEFELMLTVALVVMVIFLFLRNLAATIIPSVAVPLSLVGTFGVMYLAGLQPEQPDADGADDLDRLRGGRRHRDDRKHRPLHRGGRTADGGGAERRGADRIHDLSLTISLIAVLIPLLFMGDIVGRLFREFAITLSVTILVSAVVSLTLTPMMCSRLLRHTPESEQGTFYQASEHVFESIIEFYGRTLQWVLKHQTRHFAGCRGDTGADRFALHHRAQGIFPGAGHGGHPGHFRSPAEYFVSRHGRTAAALAQRDPEGSRRGKPLFVHRRGWHEHHAE